MSTETLQERSTTYIYIYMSTETLQRKALPKDESDATISFLSSDPADASSSARLGPDYSSRRSENSTNVTTMKPACQKQTGRLQAGTFFLCFCLSSSSSLSPFEIRRVRRVTRPVLPPPPPPQKKKKKKRAPFVDHAEDFATMPRPSASQWIFPQEKVFGVMSFSQSSMSGPERP